MSRARRALALPAFSAAFWLSSTAPELPPSIPPDDRVRVAEAFRLADRINDAIWPGWGRVPFALVLVTPEMEFFIRHPSPPADARPIGRDALLGSEVYARPRTFPTSFLATFPIDGVSTVVVGQVEQTAVSSPTDWVVTLLHEHFHQRQEASPDFYARVSVLGLSKGDTTGMWMLNFPFPYAEPPIAAAYRTAAAALRESLRGAPWTGYLAARTAFREKLSPDDLRYLDFQLWKEGVARYTQVRVAEWAASRYEPTREFASLPGFVPFADLAKSQSDAISDELSRLELPEARRTVVYPYGAAEARLLDRERPCWRDVYFAKPFTLEPAFAAADCGARPAGRG